MANWLCNWVHALCLSHCRRTVLSSCFAHSNKGCQILWGLVNCEWCYSNHLQRYVLGLGSSTRWWWVEAMISRSSRHADRTSTTTSFCNYATVLLPNIAWVAMEWLLCIYLHFCITRMGQDDVMNDDVFDYGLYLLEGILEQLGRHLTEFPANEPPLCPAPIYAIL